MVATRNLALVAALAMAMMVAPTAGACCSKYAVSGDCCNVFGCNCDGPCWNAGCKTTCAKGNYPGRSVACPGSDDKYNCCPDGSKCKANCKAGSGGGCCCTGGGKVVTEITDLKYDLNSAKSGPDAMSAQVAIKYKGENAAETPAPVGKITMTVSSSQTTSFTYTSSTTLSSSVKISGSVPFMESGSLTLTASQSWGKSDTQSKTVKQETNFDPGSDMIPGYSYQQYQFDALMQVYNIPFTATATVLDDCGSHSTTTITGTAKLSGVASFAQGQFSKIVGPAVPIECTPPFDTPIQDQKTTNFCSTGSPKCVDNALCARLGFTDGDCCTADDMEPCCAFAQAHAACTAQGYQPSAVLCPSARGSFAGCCDAAAAKSVDGSEGKFVAELEVVVTPSQAQMRLAERLAAAGAGGPPAPDDAEVEEATAQQEREEDPPVQAMRECVAGN